MARLALTVVGAVIGFMVGGPFGAQIGAMIGGMVGNILFAPSIKGPRLSDLNVTASTYGEVIPELYGTMRIGGNMIWTTGLIEKKHKSGGKGGPKQTTYTYSSSFAIAFCKGPVDAILRIWADGKLIATYAAATNPLLMAVLKLTGSLGLKHKYKTRFYKGDEDQLPDSLMLAKLGANNCPAHRGLCYVVFDDMQLEDFGNRVPQITAELTRNPIKTNPVATLTDAVGATVPGSTTKGTIDWENNRCYRYDAVNHVFIHYDLSTMNELFRVPVAASPFGDPWNDGQASFTIGGDFFSDQVGPGSNAGSLGFWNAKTGAFIDYIGLPSSALSEFPGGSHTGNFDSHLAWVGGRGQTFHFRVLTGTKQENYFLHQGNVSGAFCIWRIENVLSFYGFQWIWYEGTGEGLFGQYNWIRGKEIVGTSMAMGVSTIHGVFNHGASFNLRTIRIHEFIPGITSTTDGSNYTYSNAPFDDSIIDSVEGPFYADGETFVIQNYSYDKSDNSLVFWATEATGKWRFAKYNLDDKVWVWKWKDTDYDASYRIMNGNGAFPRSPTNTSNLSGFTVGWLNGWNSGNDSRMWRADLKTGRILEPPVLYPVGGPTEQGTYQFTSWDDDTGSILGVPKRVFFAIDSDGVSVQSIVDDVLIKTGSLTAPDFDTSALAPLSITGYVISRECSARDVLNQLASAYFFDGVESDYKIKIKLRGSSAVGNITEKHLGFVKDRDITIQETRTQEMEMPMRISVTFADVARDYQQGTQSAKRNTDPFPTMHSHVEQRFELPIAMSATNAKQIADKALKMAWNTRINYKLRLPWEFLKYDPSDVVTVTMDNGTVYDMRLAKMDMGVDFTLDTTAASERTAAYVSVEVGDGGDGFPDQQVNIGYPSDLYILNTPLLRDIDDTQGVASVFYIGSSAKSPGHFSSTYLFRSFDGVDFTDLDLLSHDMLTGYVKEALPAGFSYGLDTTTTLTVNLLTDGTETLSSITFDQLLAGGNAAMVGDEIIQFQNAVHNTDGTYTLSGILRARRGTNYATSNHGGGERFIFLDPALLLKEANPPTVWDQTQYFKSVPPGNYVENVQAQGTDMAPNDLRPYTPETVTCNDDGTTVTIGFQRRSRISNELQDGNPDIPYKEGQGSTAHFSYSVWGGKTLADHPWTISTLAPTFSGTVPIYSGTSFATLQFQFAMAGITTFVVQITEEGFVTGFPKIIQFDRIHANDWDRNELY